MHVYHGKARAESAPDLARFGVVLTTYTTMALEAPSRPDAKSGASAATPIDLCDSSSDSDADGAPPARAAAAPGPEPRRQSRLPGLQSLQLRHRAVRHAGCSSVSVREAV